MEMSIQEATQRFHEAVNSCLQNILSSSSLTREAAVQLILTEIRQEGQPRPSSEKIIDVMEKFGCTASEAEHALVVQNEMHRLEKLRFDTLTAIKIMTQKVQRLDTSTLVFDYGVTSSGINPVAFSPYINKVNPNKRNKDAMLLGTSVSGGGSADDTKKKLMLDSSNTGNGSLSSSLNVLDPMEEEAKRRKKESVSLGSKRGREAPLLEVEEGDVENLDPSNKKTRV